MSKKFLMCGILVFSIFVLSACGEDNKEDNKKEETQVIEEVKKEEAKFEEFAYYKKNNDRHFQIYTQTKNKELLIEGAKRRAWTEGKITVVSFWSSKDDNEVPYLSLAQDEETGIYMENISNLNPEKLVGVYFKDVFGKESWFNGDLFLKDSVVAEEIEEIKQ